MTSKSQVHYTRQVNPAGRSRAACGVRTDTATCESDSVTCLKCLACIAAAVKRRSVPELVSDLISEVREGWGDESVNRGAILTVLLARIVSRQIHVADLASKLIAIDGELSARGL